MSSSRECWVLFLYFVLVFDTKKAVIIWHYGTAWKPPSQIELYLKMAFWWNWTALLKYVVFVSVFEGKHTKWLAAWLTDMSASRWSGPEKFVLFCFNNHVVNLSPWQPTCRISSFSDFITEWKIFFFLASSELPTTVIFPLPPALSSVLQGKTSSSEDPLLWFALFSLSFVLVSQLFLVCIFIIWKQTRFPALSFNTSFHKVYLSGTWRTWFQFQPCQQPCQQESC